MLTCREKEPGELETASDRCLFQNFRNFKIVGRKRFLGWAERHCSFRIKCNRTIGQRFTGRCSAYNYIYPSVCCNAVGWFFGTGWQLTLGCCLNHTRSCKTVLQEVGFNRFCPCGRKCLVGCSAAHEICVPQNLQRRIRRKKIVVKRRIQRFDALPLQLRNAGREIEPKGISRAGRLGSQRQGKKK